MKTEDEQKGGRQKRKTPETEASRAAAQSTTLRLDT